MSFQRPTWLAFLIAYARVCALVVLVVLLVMGIPLALVIAWTLKQ